MSIVKYADSTMKSWTKDELIHQIRILERNITAVEERVNNQAKLLETWAPVVHGRWVYGCQCSVCGDRHGPKNERHLPFYNYCPNCGAKMDGEKTTEHDILVEIIKRAENEYHSDVTDRTLEDYIAEAILDSGYARADTKERITHEIF